MCIASIIMLTIAEVEEHIDIRISLSYHLIIIRIDTSNAMHHIHSHIHTDRLPPWRYTHMHTTMTHAYMTPSVHVHAWKRMGGRVGMHRARCPSHGTLSDRARSPHGTGAPRTCMCGTSPNPHHPTPPRTALCVSVCLCVCGTYVLKAPRASRHIAAPPASASSRTPATPPRCTLRHHHTIRISSATWPP